MIQRGKHFNYRGEQIKCGIFILSMFCGFVWLYISTMGEPLSKNDMEVIELFDNQ